MKKMIITNAIALLLGLTVMAQDRKVAVFDPAGSVDNAIKEIVREEISSIIVNSGGFTVLERKSIDKVFEENEFQKEGLVDDSQISEIGKLMGANLVFVSNITALDNNNYYISCKMVDVQTARIEKQKTARTQKSNDLIGVIQKIVGEMFSNTQQSSPVIEVLPELRTTDMLVADGRSVFLNGKKLGKKEVQSMMVNTDALRYYNKGISKNRNGNWWIAFGLIAGAGITAVEVAESDEVYGVGVLVGAGLITTGIIVKSGSKKAVGKAVNLYNGGSKTSSMELKVGFTGNGLGLALNF